jgi:AcrR family transcriptional regulator
VVASAQNQQHSGPVIASSADRRREQIVEVAAELFQQEGYHRASMERLAERAGLAKPSLYHYFKSKEDVLFQIHLEFIEPLLRRQEARLGLGMGLREQLLESIGDILELMETHGGYVRVFFEHHRELSDARQEAVMEKRSRYQHMVEDVIAAGIAAGEFRDVDPRLATLAVFGMCNWAYQWYRPNQDLTTTELAAFLHDLFLSGLQVPAKD